MIYFLRDAFTLHAVSVRAKDPRQAVEKFVGWCGQTLYKCASGGPFTVTVYEIACLGVDGRTVKVKHDGKPFMFKQGSGDLLERFTVKMVRDKEAGPILKSVEPVKEQ